MNPNQSQNPTTWWGTILAFIRVFFALGIKSVNVVDEAVEMADIQVTAMREKQEVEVALDMASMRTQSIQRAALANAQVLQVTKKFSAEHPELAAYLSEENKRLEEAVDAFAAKRAARNKGLMPGV